MPRPRLTIGRLMAAIAAVGVVFAVVRSGVMAAFVSFFALMIAAIGWLPTRPWPRVAKWSLVVSATWVNLAVASFYLFLPHFGTGLGMLLALGTIAPIPIVAGCGLAWVEHRPGWAAKLRGAVVVAALVVLPMSMIWTRWPLRLGLYLSAPALERLALRIEAGEAFVGPEWAGLYRVRAARRMFNGPDLGLVVGGDRTGDSFFIRSSTAPQPVGVDVFPPRAGVAGHWCFFQED